MSRIPCPIPRATDKRGALHARVDYWRKAAKPAHEYGEDGGGRNRVPVICTWGAEIWRYEYTSAETWRTVGTRDREAGCGWYTSPDCDETMHGIVAYLGKARWIAGYEWTGNGQRAWHIADRHASARDAAIAADSLAQSYAEREMEHAQRWHAARQLEGEVEDGMQRLRECLVLRHNPKFPNLRDEARELIQSIRRAAATLDDEYADYV